VAPVTSGAGLVWTVPAWTAVIDGKRVSRKTNESKTVSATKAIWWYGDQAGVNYFAEGTIGAGEPSTHSGYSDRVLLGVAESGGATISEVRDPHPVIGGGAGVKGMSPSALNWGIYNPGFDEVTRGGSGPTGAEGWEFAVTNSGTAAVVQDHVNSGRYSVRFRITGATDTAIARSRMFPLAPAWVDTSGFRLTCGYIYDDDGVTALPKMNVGLRFYNTDYDDLGLGAACGGANDVPSTGSGTSNGLSISGAFTTSAATATATAVDEDARWARFEINVAADTVGGSYNQDIYISNVFMFLTYT